MQHDASRPTLQAKRHRRRGQAGLTLIEMVVTIAIVAIGLVGIAYGFTAAVGNAGSAQVEAQLNGAASYVANYLQSDDTTGYQACVSTYAVPSPLPSPYGGVPPPVISVSESAASQSSPGPGYTPLSGPGVFCSNDYGVQEITITVTDGGQSVMRVVWKEHRA
ncbi:MAG TPA: type II secretion system protein [Candidatus Binatia bacterium]|nr:type II secretion system protein [Candidatus Binatia bacterium]